MEQAAHPMAKADKTQNLWWVSPLDFLFEEEKSQVMSLSYHEQ